MNPERNLRRVGVPKKLSDCEELVRLRRRGMSVRAVAQQLGDWIGDCSAGVEELHSPNWAHTTSAGSWAGPDYAKG